MTYTRDKIFFMNLSINIKGCNEESSTRNTQVDFTYKDVGLSSSSLFKLELILLQRKIGLEVI